MANQTVYFQSLIQPLVGLCTVVISIIIPWHLTYGMSSVTKITFIYDNRLKWCFYGLFGTTFNMREESSRDPRGHLSRELPAHSSTRTPYDKKSIIVKPCPAVEESVRLSQAGYKIFQRFYHCSAQSNVHQENSQKT